MSTCLKCILPALLLLEWGCGGSPVHFKTAPVQGILTCQGKPVPGVQVVFSPQAGAGRTEKEPGKSAIGLTDEAGRFVLSTYRKNDGAVLGTHTVTVVFNDEPDNPFRDIIKKVFPPCLNESRQIEVVQGMVPIDLNLGQ